ncbi:MAG: formate dehydrogenase accessory sulfurtransferase FdhD [Xanthomonadales bacterium]|nr:formate dehydrogenase accessory sulfurtransferase FdhD [Xanthomonadales bacterium]
MSTGLRAREALHIADGTHAVREEWVIEEMPVALLYNGLSFAVMMATPADLEDFALGFAVCEGIVASADEFSLVDVVHGEYGIALHAAIPQSRFDAIEHRQRTLEGRSGCGLCGVSSLQSAVQPVRAVGTGPRLSAAQIHAGLARLSQLQPLNARSGGVHAAGFVQEDRMSNDRMLDESMLDESMLDESARAKGMLVREDVGRHNALDKLVGAMLRATPSVDPGAGFLAITSRASYEIVHKAANAGIAVIAAMSAPTELAILQAEAAGITLIAFARDARMNVYCGRERLR